MVTLKSTYGAGSRGKEILLINMVEELAESEPDAVYAIWPVIPTSYEAGVRSITWAQLNNMVNGLAWWLDDHLGKSANEVFAYVGPNDVRTPALGLAGIKSGNSLFVTSPRNSIEAHASLFSRLKCTTFVSPTPVPPLARPILEALKPRHLLIPSVEELLQTAYPHYGYSKPFEEGLRDTVMIIHTSGSTGIPKPLIWSQETVLKHQNASRSALMDELPSLESVYAGKRIMSTLPLFHGAGLGQTWFNAIPFRSVIITPAAAAIVTAQGLVDALRQTPADIALLVPSVVAELAQNPDLLQYCAENLEMIAYIGGDLPQQIGDTVAAALPFRTQWGASEVGMPPQLIPPALDAKTDWKYVRFHPSTGMIMEKVSDNLYELVMRRDGALKATQTTFTIPGKQGLDEYRTRDLFSPHPTIPDEWAWMARADDIVVFLNGEKTNPISMEQYVVARNPGILSGAVVIGAQRLQAGLIIEPVNAVQNTAEQAAMIDAVWPCIEEANRFAPAHARVVKSLVLVTEPGRPLVRAGKGTLQRGHSIVQYEAEIEHMYADLDEADIINNEGVQLNAMTAEEGAVVHYVRQAVLEATKWADLSMNISFFELGMDSLQALSLLRALRRTFNRPDIGLSTIYQHSTVSQLTKVLMTDSSKVSDSDSDDKALEEMQSLLATYRQLVRKIPVPSQRQGGGKPEGPIDAILTGSTGTLGSLLLRSLLNRPGIRHIFCLNRGVTSLAEKPSGLPAGRVTFLQANLAKPNLGIDEADYQRLQENVGLIIHSAWPVNFNLSLATFRPQLAGMVNLFSLAASAGNEPRFLFISSIGAVAGSTSDTAAPEAIIESLDAAHKNGYARSKLISEILCDEAARHLDITISIARVGQIAGPSTVDGQTISSWSRAEWLPSLVISSFHLECIPVNLGPRFSDIDWIPSDLTAEVIADLALAGRQSAVIEGAAVFNLRNPKITSWGNLVPVLQELSKELFGKSLDVVSPSMWLGRLESSVRRDSTYAEDEAADTVKQTPAVKLFDFYRDGLWGGGKGAEPMSIDKTLDASTAFRTIPAVEEAWMRRWVRGWFQ